MNPDDVRRWAGNQRAAAARERAAVRQHPLNASQAFASALSLLVYDENLNGSPFDRNDPVALREDALMREAWTKLRARWHHGR
jgi:hypothetical protein